MNNPNLQRLIDAAEKLHPLLGELVFVGGAVTGLLITDDAAADSRITFDVDAIQQSHPTRSTPSSGRVYAHWNSAKTCARARLYAAG